MYDWKKECAKEEFVIKGRKFYPIYIIVAVLQLMDGLGRWYH